MELKSICVKDKSFDLTKEEADIKLILNEYNPDEHNSRNKITIDFVSTDKEQFKKLYNAKSISLNIEVNE